MGDSVLCVWVPWPKQFFSFDPCFWAGTPVLESVVIISMKQDINALALAAKDNDAIREELILQQEKFILRTASLASFRFVTKSDDEWSIALYAFSDSIDHYSAERGNFLPFARMLIRRSLIDWHRSNASYQNEITVSPFVLEGQCGEEADDTEKAVCMAVNRQSMRQSEGGSLQDEIIAANQALELYGFRFFDLTECSPKQDRTKEQCAEVIRYVIARPELVRELEWSRKLPVQAIVKGSGVSRKLIDRYRKYLIMAVVILCGDYPHLAEYLKFVRREAQA